MLLAHNGVDHQQHKSSSDRRLESPPESDRPVNSNDSLPIQETLTTPTPTQQNSTERSQIIEDEPVISTSDVTLVPGFGESIFALLIASPFILLSIKRWVHR